MVANVPKFKPLSRGTRTSASRVVLIYVVLWLCITDCPENWVGRITVANLTTLCANCHKAVHWLSGEGRLAGKEGDQARRIYSASAFAKLAELAEVIQAQRARTKQAGNRWLKQADTEGQMSLADALRLVSRRNHFDLARAAILEQVVQRVLAHLSAEALKGCSIRLVQRGRFFSINAGNILVFRVPGVFDGVKDQDGDVLLLWPERIRLSVLSRDEWREIQAGEGRFAAIPCFNLPLDFEQVLKMVTTDWGTFSQACHDAVRLGKGRQWISNVDLSAGRAARVTSSLE